MARGRSRRLRDARRPVRDGARAPVGRARSVGSPLLTGLPASPYKGLAPFDDSELDARFFFGREREIGVVCANLAASRLTVLYGPSGVGKSSLLRAGVAQRLRSLVPAGGIGGGGSAVVGVVSSWRDDPVGAVAATVGARRPGRNERLADVLAERADNIGGEIYLILDQMEEYFLYTRRRGGVLAEELEEVLVRPELLVHILLGIRDDALSELDALKARLPKVFANVVRLDHLERTGAAAAILGPLAAYSEAGGSAVDAEPELVEALLDQLAAGRARMAPTADAAPDAHHVEAPYLQLVLERLWNAERDAGSTVMRLSTLERLGGATNIVEEHLVHALETLDPRDRDVASRLFNHLVTPSGTKIAHGLDDLSRYAGDEPATIEAVLEALASGRIVRPLRPVNGGVSRYEIFHDVLAEPVLQWRSRHEAEQTLERERIEARRRHRRLAAVAAVAIAAFAFTAALAIYAFAQRSEANDKERSAQARALRAEALSLLPVDPERSVRLATRAAAIEPGPAVERELRMALLADRSRTILDAGGAPVRSLELSSDSRMALVGAENGIVRLLDLASGRVVFERRHPGGLSSAAMSADTNLVATGGPDGTVRLWSRDGGVRVFRRGAEVLEVAVGATGLIAAAGGGTAVHVIDSRGRLVQTLRHAEPTARAIFSDDGRLLLTLAIDAHVFDMRTGELLATLDQPGEIVSAAFSRDGALVATGGRDDLASVWEARTGKTVVTFPAHIADVRDVNFSPDGALLVTASSDNAGRVWDIASGSLASFLVGHSNHVVRGAFGPDGLKIVTAGLDGNAWVWYGNNYALRGALLGHVGPVTHALITSDGETIVTAGADGSVRTWAATVDPELRTIATHPEGARDLALSPDGHSLASVGTDGTVRTWTRTGRARHTMQHGGVVETVAYSRDGRLVASGGDDGFARVWRADGASIRAIDVGSTVRGVAFGPEGLLATAGDDGVAGLWRPDGSLVHGFRHRTSVADVAFDRAGVLLATAGEDGVVRLWRVRDGKLLHELEGHEGPATAVSFTHDGRFVIGAGADGTARTWDAATGAVGRTLRGHSSIVSGVAASPDGRWLVTAGPITAGLWEAAGPPGVEAGHPLVYLRGHGPRVRAAVFASDSRTIFTAGDDGTIRKFTCGLCGGLQSLVDIAERRRERLGRSLDAAARTRFLND